MATRVLIASMSLLLVASTGWASEQQPSIADKERRVTRLQSSHISANVPPDAKFMVFLQRDVRAYLVANRLPSKGVTIEPLRMGPTQTGVSYPKYYLWVRAVDDAGHDIEGAMRVAAVDRVRFDVTDFTSASSIRSDPASLGSIYPAALITTIRHRAGAK